MIFIDMIIRKSSKIINEMSCCSSVVSGSIIVVGLHLGWGIVKMQPILYVKKKSY